MILLRNECTSVHLLENFHEIMELLRLKKNISDHQVQPFSSACLAYLCWVYTLDAGVVSKLLLLSHPCHLLVCPLYLLVLCQGTSYLTVLHTPWFLEEECVRRNLRLEYVRYSYCCVFMLERGKDERKSTCTCVLRFGLLPECRLGPWDWVDHHVNFGSFVDLWDTLTSGRTRTSFVACWEATFRRGESTGCTHSTCFRWHMLLCSVPAGISKMLEALCWSTWKMYTSQGRSKTEINVVLFCQNETVFLTQADIVKIVIQSSALKMAQDPWSSSCPK